MQFIESSNTCTGVVVDGIIWANSIHVTPKRHKVEAVNCWEGQMNSTGRFDLNMYPRTKYLLYNHKSYTKCFVQDYFGVYSLLGNANGRVVFLKCACFWLRHRNQPIRLLLHNGHQKQTLSALKSWWMMGFVGVLQSSEHILANIHTIFGICQWFIKVHHSFGIESLPELVRVT